MIKPGDAVTVKPYWDQRVVLNAHVVHVYAQDWVLVKATYWDREVEFQAVGPEKVCPMPMSRFAAV